jgi:exonuclease VII small subunit
MDHDRADESLTWALTADEDAFAEGLRRRSFEQLRDTVEAIADQVTNDAIGVDELAVAVRRAQAILAECQRRIEAVEVELRQLSDAPGEETP